MAWEFSNLDVDRKFKDWWMNDERKFFEIQNPKKSNEQAIFKNASNYKIRANKIKYLGFWFNKDDFGIK